MLDDLTGHPEVTTEFADHPRVRFVEIRSPDYLRALATAKYLINNATFPQQLAKRPEQVYVNTWHGAPLKHMGFDMPEGGVLSRNITRNFLNADYLLSANPYMTDTMYRSAYRMQGIFRGAVDRGGPPAHRPAGRGDWPIRVRSAGGSRPAASPSGTARSSCTPPPGGARRSRTRTSTPPS